MSYTVFNSNTNACFVNWVVRSLNKNRQINVVDDQYNNPTWTMSIARVILLCIEKFGLYHWGDKDILSRYEFSKIAKIFNLDSSLIKPIKTSELSQIAKRPQFWFNFKKWRMHKCISSINKDF